MRPSLPIGKKGSPLKTPVIAAAAARCPSSALRDRVTRWRANSRKPRFTTSPSRPLLSSRGAGLSSGGRRPSSLRQRLRRDTRWNRRRGLIHLWHKPVEKIGHIRSKIERV
ncbi:hypothetical protein NL676_031849 [Syzygium grande]|nr:hypothetical protein NL676_031849 [Syzygium grande]